MRLRWSTIRAAVAAAALAALFAACSGDDKPASTLTAVPSTATESTAEASPTAPIAAGTPRPTPNPTVYAELRQRLFIATAADLQFAPSPEHPHVWGVLMELNLDPGTATLVALVDGTVSLYTSTQGGVRGAGDYPNVRQAGLALLSSAEKSLDQMALYTNSPLPDPGQVRFYALTFDGTFSAAAPEADLDAQTHPLSQLFADGEAVLAEIRNASVATATPTAVP